MIDPTIAELRKTRPVNYYYQLTREEAATYRETISRLSTPDLRYELKICDHRERQDFCLEELRNR